jgi:hypothetical protein
VTDRIEALDTRILVAIRTHGHTPALDRAVAAFSKTGEHAACWLALGAAAAAIDHDRRGDWLRAAGVVAASSVANTALKFGVAASTWACTTRPTSLPVRCSGPRAG